MERATFEVFDFPAEADIPRRSDGRFDTTIGLYPLLDRVAVVARHAAGEGDPNGVSARRFNLAAKEMGRDWPSAQMVEARFRTSLKRVIGEALRPPSERELFGQPDRDRQVARDMPAELMGTIIRACHLACGFIPRPSDYDKWADDRRRARDRRHVLREDLPHSTTITLAFGSWQQALASAGLIAEGESIPREDHRAATGVVELLDRFINETGLLPQRKHFESWCRAQGLPVGRDVRQWSARVEEVRVARTAAGLTTPETATAPKDCPALPEKTAAADGVRRGGAGQGYSDDEMIASLHYYRDHFLGAGVMPRQKHYNACAKGNPNMCSSGVFARAGGFVAACRKAGI